jgi:hypothetical protein
MTMKLSQALQAKKKLAGDIAELKVRLLTQNSRPSKQPFDYDTHAVLEELRKKITELADLKAKIAAANVPIYQRIFYLAELKGLSTHLATMETKSGTFTEGGGWRTDKLEVEYVVQINKAAADKLVADLKDEITRVQSELDAFNYTTEI